MDYPGKVITKTAVTPTQTSATGVWTLDDAAAAVRNNNWPVAGVPNPISKSLRFNSADSAYLNRTPASAGNQQIHTFSGWVKYSTSSSDRQIISFGNSLTYQIVFGASGTKLAAGSQQLGVSNPWYVETTQVFRDPSAWYHIVVATDTTQATSSNRVKIYVNGTQVTAFGTANYPTQNYNTGANTTTSHSIGRREDASQYFNGYITEINWIDGQALTPSSFGMTDPQTGAWEPIKYTGTYGTNGFYLNFKDATSTTTLGYDYSGNGNNWTTNNFSVTAGAGNDSLTDVPTPWIAYNTTGDVGGVVRGNYATWNPISPTYALGTGTLSLSNGNLDASLSTTSGGGGSGNYGSSITVNSGKWYAEILLATQSGGFSGDDFGMGVVPAFYPYNAVQGSGSGGVVYIAGSGNKRTDSGGTTAYGSSYTAGDIISIALNMDAGEVTFYKNGVSQGVALTGLTGLYKMIVQINDNLSRSRTVSANFGQRPFAYTPPAGFLSLCTTNLPNPTIGTLAGSQAGNFFNANLYTGTGSAFTLTGVGFQPDFGWFKGRNASSNHWLHDVVRGANPGLSSNNTLAEDTTAGQLTAFASDGYSLPNDTAGYLNFNGRTMVVWSWKAGGTGVTNTAGTITSTVSANTTSGCSIVTYTGNGGSNSSIGHGLGVAPSMIITKGRSGAAVNNWLTWHGTFGVSSYIALNLTSAVNYAGATTTVYGGSSVTAPNSTTYTIGVDLNTNTATYVAYCFAAVAGYSAFGSYTGNGSTDGPFVYTGFRPRYIMRKRTDTTAYWVVFDTARNTYNVVGEDLYPNDSLAGSNDFTMDILSNGFKIRGSGTNINANGGTYIYAAFAEFPFKFANAR